MSIWHEPTWTKIHYAVEVGAVGVVGLYLLKLFKGFTNRKRTLNLDPEQYVAWLESELQPPQEPEPVSFASHALKLLWSKARVLIYPILVVLFLICAFGGFGYAIQSYRVISNVDEGDECLRRQDYVGAIVAFRKALRADDLVANTHYRLAVALYSHNRTEEAITELRRAIKLDPLQTESHLLMGLLMDRKNLLEESRQEYSKVVSMEPTNAIGYVDLANILYMMGRREDAFREYEYAVKLAPEDMSTHLNYANALIGVGRLEEGLTEADAAIKAAPNNILVHYCKGNVLYRMHRYEEASAQYRQTVEIQQDFGYGYFSLGKSLAATGHNADAVEAFNSYLRILKKKPEYTGGESETQYYLNKLVGPG